MESLRYLYRLGIGPSSSHTMGPVYASQYFLEQYPDATHYKVVLFGSLAATGRGHGTDRALYEAFGDNALDIEWDFNTATIHPNTLDMYAYNGTATVGYAQIYSVGGGEIVVAGKPVDPRKNVYAEKSFAKIKKICQERGIRLWQYVEEQEGTQIYDYLEQVWQAMNDSIDRGLVTEGVLSGGLGVVRRAKKLSCALDKESERLHENRTVASYAFATAEQNASGGLIVTAPTCGACGVLPAVFRYYYEHENIDKLTIMHGLMTAGLVGNLIKTNASISGAACGCQAEIGSACCMTAAGLSEMLGRSLDEIETSAEIALEHHLGLTCDPVEGLVQIPCIERNAVAAMRAINASSISTFLAESTKVSLDTVINTMYETGKDLSDSYRETASGGLAKNYNRGRDRI